MKILFSFYRENNPNEKRKFLEKNAQSLQREIIIKEIQKIFGEKDILFLETDNNIIVTIRWNGIRTKEIKKQIGKIFLDSYLPILS